MKNRFWLGLLAAVLVSCGSPVEPSLSSSSITPSSSSSIFLSSSEDPSSNEQSPTPSSVAPSLEESSQSSPTGQSSSSSSKQSSSIQERIPASGETLPIGNRTVSGPQNAAPIDITNWVNFDLFSSLPSYFSYIQGNNKIGSCTNFYAESAGGGFKFAQLYYGFQTPLLTSFKKVEVRFHISNVAQNSQNKDDGEPIFHIYEYNDQGQYIGMETLDQGRIIEQTKGNQVTVYLRNESMAYFEVRLNAFPYKSGKCYNFGVDVLSVKGWNYD